MEYAREQYLHRNSFMGISGQTALEGVLQRSVLDLWEVYPVIAVGDGMHLEKELQSREGGVAMYHLIQDAAQAPDIRSTTNLRRERRQFDANESYIPNQEVAMNLNGIQPCGQTNVCAN